MLILGIETSCDETSAALVEDGNKVLSNVVFSQIEIHKPFKGVVPEVASRNHLVKIIPVIQESLGNKSLREIDAVAVTQGPGLIGALLIGMTTAKAISLSLDKPLIPVNHIEAHSYAPHLTQDIPFPYISLIISGGHTLIYEVHSYTESKLLGSTIDDAIGEAYDKIAKILGLEYPGGPVIDKLAKNGNPNFMDLPKILPKENENRYQFSYSGLKTAIIFRLKKMTDWQNHISDICASFQKCAVELLIRKTLNVSLDTGIKAIVLSGGVSANSYLRNKFLQLKEKDFKIYLSDLLYCGDNAAMVAGRAFVNFNNPSSNYLKTEVFSRLSSVIKGDILPK